MSAHSHQQLTTMCQRNGEDVTIITEWLEAMLPDNLDYAVSIYCETATRMLQLID